MKKNFKLENVTIGSDLEIFLKNKNTGELASAVGIIGGTKDDPKFIGNLCYVQEDNILAEANIPPVTSFENFYKYIEYIKTYILENHPEYDLHYVSSENVQSSLLLNEQARTFGCDPVLIADYNKDGDVVPDDEFEDSIMMKKMSNKRTGGFHIHIGYNNPTPEISKEIVKLFEKNVTLNLLKDDIDPYNRREFYGKSGEYRLKPYGLECRSLGSALLRSEETLKKVWDLVQKTIQEFNQGERVSKQEFKIIKEIINTNN